MGVAASAAALALGDTRSPAASLKTLFALQVWIHMRLRASLCELPAVQRWRYSGSHEKEGSMLPCALLFFFNIRCRRSTNIARLSSLRFTVPRCCRAGLAQWHASLRRAGGVLLSPSRRALQRRRLVSNTLLVLRICGYRKIMAKPTPRRPPPAKTHQPRYFSDTYHLWTLVGTADLVGFMGDEGLPFLAEVKRVQEALYSSSQVFRRRKAPLTESFVRWPPLPFSAAIL